jgi:hypothetical protein
MKQVNEKKFKDDYLKPVILDSIKKVEEFAKTKRRGDRIVYYEGNFQEDVLNNFSPSESEQIFDTMKKYLNDVRFIFLQKKVKITNSVNEISELNEPKHFYEYIVSKRVF